MKRLAVVLALVSLASTLAAQAQQQASHNIICEVDSGYYIQVTRKGGSNADIHMVVYYVAPVTVDDENRLSYGLNRIGPRGTQIRMETISLGENPTWLVLRLRAFWVGEAPHRHQLRDPSDYYYLAGGGNSSTRLILIPPGGELGRWEEKAILEYSAYTTNPAVPAGTTVAFTQSFIIEDVP